MIELEVQTLSHAREGLLVELGRLLTATGFTLIRQRLTDDPHGVLMSMVVRGPGRRQRALEAALDAVERIISFEVSPVVAGEVKAHFAASRPATASAARAPAPVITATPASRSMAPTTAVPATTAERSAPAAPIAATPTGPTAVAPAVVEAVPAAAKATAVPQAERAGDSPVAEPAEARPPSGPTAEPLVPPEAAPFLDALPPTPPAPSGPPPATPAPFVEITPLEADELAVDEALASLSRDYPRIVPHLLALDRTVEPGARESSLMLAGRRAGDWLRRRDYPSHAQLDLPQAIATIALPALRALVEVEQRGMQVQIRDSPLCTEDGRSGCTFYSGYLEGVLGPALASDALTIFPVCCRSYGADDCVLDLSD